MAISRSLLMCNVYLVFGPSNLVFLTKKGKYLAPPQCLHEYVRAAFEKQEQGECARNMLLKWSIYMRLTLWRRLGQLID
ncbi:hypothetical protein EDB83DRAFT_2398211 [Lactarius deliciosus]|nr:hypothetical protein EDB83DRAFT_2398211 [Lactarius deliciosus]